MAKKKTRLSPGTKTGEAETTHPNDDIRPTSTTEKENAMSEDTPIAEDAPVKRESATAGWTKSIDGKMFSKTVTCSSPEKAAELARRVIKISLKGNTPVTMKLDQASIGFELNADGKKFAGGAAKLGRSLRDAAIEKYTSEDASEQADPEPSA